MNWLFRRDEIDLFEHEYEKLRALSKRPRKLALRQVFQEQDATEAKAQVELEIALLPFDLESTECPIHAEQAEDDFDDFADTSLEELLEPISSFDELSAHASAWSRALCESINGKDEEQMEFIRIRMNAPLIVAKLTFAAEEEAFGDEPALIIADKELELGEIYLRRVLESLRNLAREERLSQALVSAATMSGHVLMHAIKERRYDISHGDYPGA